MTLEEIFKEYEKGCGNTCLDGKPSDCKECLDAAVRAVNRYHADELATLRSEVERLKQCVKDQVDDNAIAFGDGWNAALEEAAHLIECDGDAFGGKSGAAKAIRGLMAKEALK